LGPSSFGLPADGRGKEYTLEEVFQLVEHCHFSYESARRLPVELRRWWIRRKSKEKERMAGRPKNESSSEPRPMIPQEVARHLGMGPR
jgi:hypothetical protein